jgi:formate C-acetyltransferase
MNPGHIDQHLWPFYQKGIEEGTLTREQAKELLCCLWIKFNNQPAPPKVGVTALESGTYNDFTNINIGGVDRNGKSAANELSYIILEIQEELHELQPGLSIHIAENTPDEFLLEGIKVIRQGHGYPSIFNPDTYVQEMVRAGKSLEDAREGGCSGCIEVGAFGKEAYLLTGYLNTPKILEITLNNGVDPETGKQLGLETGDPRSFKTYEELYDAWHRQMVYFVNLKLSVNNYIERMFSLYAPATFLSLYIDDCIEKGKDYYSGGARYNTTYIQCTGLGTITDCLATLKKHVFEDRRYTMDEILEACRNNWGTAPANVQCSARPKDACYQRDARMFNVQLNKFAFSGIHLFHPSLAPLLSDWPERFPIMDFYLSACADHLIRGYEAPGLRLLDVGKLDTLEQAEAFIDGI